MSKKKEKDSQIPSEELKKLAKGLGKQVQINLDPREWEAQKK